MLSLAVSLGLLAAIANLPPIPTYERGFITGALLVGLAWAISWAVWVTSGLSLRLNGAWAEDATNEVLKEQPRVFAAIPSLKLEKGDIDAVAVTRSGVLAIETKWMLRPNVQRLDDFAYRAARDARTLRLLLRGQGLNDSAFVGVVAIWGPAAEGMKRHLRSTPIGDVWVTGGHELDSLIDELPSAHIGPDYARTLVDHVRMQAETRDAAQPGQTRLLRRLARVR